MKINNTIVQSSAEPLSKHINITMYISQVTKWRWVGLLPESAEAPGPSSVWDRFWFCKKVNCFNSAKRSIVLIFQKRSIVLILQKDQLFWFSKKVKCFNSAKRSILLILQKDQLLIQSPHFEEWLNLGTLMDRSQSFFEEKGLNLRDQLARPDEGGSWLNSVCFNIKGTEGTIRRRESVDQESILLHRRRCHH